MAWGIHKERRPYIRPEHLMHADTRQIIEHVSKANDTEIQRIIEDHLELGRDQSGKALVDMAVAERNNRIFKTKTWTLHSDEK